MIVTLNNNNLPDRISFNTIKKLSTAFINKTIEQSDLKAIDYIFEMCNQYYKPGMKQSELILTDILNTDGSNLFDPNTPESNFKTIISYLSGSSGYLGYSWGKTLSEGETSKTGCFIKDSQEKQQQHINNIIKKQSEKAQEETKPEIVENKKGTKTMGKNTQTELIERIEKLENENLALKGILEKLEKIHSTLEYQVIDKMVYHHNDEKTSCRQTYLYNSTDIRLQEAINTTPRIRSIDLIDTVINIGLDCLGLQAYNELPLDEIKNKYDELKTARSKNKKNDE